MEILKRAGTVNDGDLVSPLISEKELKSEVNHRSHKAGYTDRDGQPKRSRNNGAGKGDVFRPCNKELYDQNYERIFGHR